MVTIGRKEIPLTRDLVAFWFVEMLMFVWCRRFAIVMTVIAFLPIFLLGWLASYVQTSTEIPDTFTRRDIADGFSLLANTLAVIQIVALGGVLAFVGGRASGRR